MSQKTKQQEIQYLAYLLRLYRQQQSGQPINAELTSLTHEDEVKIRALLQSLKNSHNLTKQEYENGYTQETGLPVWLQGSPLYQRLCRDAVPQALPSRPKSLTEIFIDIGDAIKRIFDLTEDILSTFRVAGLLSTIADLIIRGVIGGLNLLITVFEFGKSIHAFYQAWNSLEKFRKTNMIAASLRASFSMIGIAICILYIANVILLPFALVGISAATLPIFITSLAKDTWIYLKTRNKLQTHDPINQEIGRLKNLQIAQGLSPEQTYRLTSLNAKVTNDHKVFLDAEREMSFSSIEIFAYLFIATGSVLSLVIFFNPAILAAASTAALATTVIGVGIATAVKVFQLVDERYDFKFTRGIRNFFAGNTTPPIIDLENIRPATPTPTNLEPPRQSTNTHTHLRKRLNKELHTVINTSGKDYATASSIAARQPRSSNSITSKCSDELNTNFLFSKKPHQPTSFNHPLTTSFSSIC